MAKIDRSFVRSVGVEPQDTAIASATWTWRDLGLGVVAEGVETAEQLAALTRLGCGQAQGYLISEPRPADKLTPLLDAAGPWLTGRGDVPAQPDPTPT